MSGAEQLEMHKQQVQLEQDNGNSLRAFYFEPMDEKTCHMNGNKSWTEGARRVLENMREKFSLVSLA